HAKVSSPNGQRPFSPARGNWSSCPSTACGEAQATARSGGVETFGCPGIRRLGPSRRPSNWDEPPPDWCPAPLGRRSPPPAIHIRLARHGPSLVKPPPLCHDPRKV